MTKRFTGRLSSWLAALMLATASIGVSAGSIALVIDDVGYNPEQGVEALRIPGKLTYAILPGTPHATMLAEMAHAGGKEILVHIPMESEHHKKLGPEGLTLAMPEAEYKQTVLEALNTVPYARGFNNHMGSLLTQHRIPMQWLMQVLEQNNLLFLDSRTTTETVAETVAVETGIPAFRRDVFLDNDRDTAAIEKQFAELVWLSKRRGFATGIGHPYPETLEVIRRMLPELQAQGIKLVFLSERASENTGTESLQAEKPEQGSISWQESSYPSPKVVKN